MKAPVQLVPISPREKREFLSMAAEYFSELNPEFKPREDWEALYFERLQNDSGLFAHWIVSEGKRAGFTIYGLESHRFLPRTIGCIYEIYIVPSFRGSGIGRRAAMSAIQDLNRHSPARVQLEIVSSNERGRGFWRSLGFRKVSERYVIDGSQK